MGQIAIDFCRKYQDAANGAAAGTKIFAETILAAAALESGYAQSELSAKYNNFFGIKAQHGDGWMGKIIALPTHEFMQGKWIKVMANFRVYDSAEESFLNYVHFISGPRYQRAGVLDALTVQDQFICLHQAGYATDPHYPVKLNDILNLLLQTNTPLIA